MKSKIRKLFILFSLAIVSYSCSSGGHYHDGNYQTEIMFTTVNFAIDGNEISIDNSLTGISKLYCKQFPDRIEYKEEDGTTRILTALDNGDLKFSDVIILRKINKLQGSTADVVSEKNSSVYNEALNLIKPNDGFASRGDFKIKVDELYKIHMNEVLRDGSVIDSDEVFTADITNDDKDEVIKYYTLATSGGGVYVCGQGHYCLSKYKNRCGGKCLRAKLCL